MQKEQQSEAKIPSMVNGDQLPDIFDIFREYQGSSFYMKFYLQQDHYEFTFPSLQNQVKMQQFIIHNQFNRHIHEAVIDTLLLNKFINKNSSIVSNLIESGREMLDGNSWKRNLMWQQFLNRKQFRMIRQAYYSQTKQYQKVIQFTVLSISNLFLRLSINIARLACILTFKKNTSNVLSIPTLSLVYLQYLMHKHFEGKKFVDELEKSQFLRQLPKITYIKFSQIINKEQLTLLEISQHSLFTKQSFVPIRNIQYLQFYQKQQKHESYHKLTNYKYIDCINLKQRYGISSPYGFQMLFLFRMIYFNVIKEFQPDVIIFVEDYDSQKRNMVSMIRGLLLNQLMEEVTAKIYVMREVGYKKSQEIIFGQINSQKLTNSLNQTTKSEDRSMSTINDTNSMIDEDQLQKPDQKSSFPNFDKIIQQRINSMPLLTKQIQSRLNKQEQNKLYGEYQKKHDHIVNSQIQKYYSPIIKIQQILRDDLNYVCLSLIQKSNFEQIFTESHKYIYNESFLLNISKDIENNWLSKDIQDEVKKQRRELERQLRLAKNIISTMIQNSKLTWLEFSKNSYDSIWDIRKNDSVQLTVIEEGNQIKTLRYKDDDHVYVHYSQKYGMIVFIFKLQSYLILRRSNRNSSNFEYVLKQTLFGQNMVSYQPTYIVTDRFIFKGFGILKNGEEIIANNLCNMRNVDVGKYLQKGHGIFRANYLDLLEKKINQSSEQKQNKKKNKNNPLQNKLFWEFISHISVYKNQKINLLTKTLGWGLVDKNFNRVIFMGGQGHECVNENKINKYLHICSENFQSVTVRGKTTRQIFLNAINYRLKVPLYPFIYGLPFTINNNECLILNTNGMNETFTNCYKLYLTQFKLSSLQCQYIQTNNVNNKKQGKRQNKQKDAQSPQQLGIRSQMKMYVDGYSQEEKIRIITVKNHLVYYIVNSYNYVNTYENRYILQTLDEGVLELELLSRQMVNQRELIPLKLNFKAEEMQEFNDVVIYFQAYPEIKN